MTNNIDIFGSGVGYIAIFIGLIMFFYGIIIDPNSRMDNTPTWFFGLLLIAVPLGVAFIESTPEQREKYFKIALLFVVGTVAIFIAIKTVGPERLIARIALGVATSIVVSTIAYFLGLKENIELYSIGIGIISIAISVIGLDSYS